ncbi:MAG TPA: hypothetical protein VEY33_01200 [Gemmatimonadota bacterium]|nr:hypothetical protein [Gemmatimonadota bacterium]
MKWPAISLAALAAVFVLACADDTTGPDGIVRFETSFETGLDGFTADGTDLDDPPIEWSIERTNEEADDGAWSVRLDLANLNDAGKIWIERSFDLEAGRAYDVELSYAFGSSDFGDINLWTIIAGVSPGDPEVTDDLTFQGSTANGEDQDVGLVWLEKSHDFTATAGAGGELWVALGVWGTSEFPRTYYLDDVEITFTPR